MNHEWEEPIPLTPLAPSSGPFPLECLPLEVCAFVEELAESTQTPEEMGGVLSLGALSACVFDKYGLEVNSDWLEALCLYLEAIAASGERKSAVIAKISAPLYDYQKRRQERERVAVLKSKSEYELLEKELENQKRAATSTSKKTSVADKELARERVKELSEEIANFKVKHEYRLLVDDITPERLSEVMEEQGGCIVTCSEEGGIFGILAGRYSGRQPNLDLFLKGHDGAPYSRDRVNSAKNRIDSAKIVMIIAMQPGVLEGIINHPAFKDRGLVARCIYVLCTFNSKIGRRKISPEPMREETKNNFHALLTRLLEDTNSGTIRISPEADKVRESYQELVEKWLDGKWGMMRDWGSKSTGTMLRIAAILHIAGCTGNPTEKPISAEIMEAAVKIIEYLGIHAEAAHKVMGADPVVEDAKYMMKRFVESGKDTLTKRELFQLCDGHIKKMAAMEPGIALLAEHCFIRWEKIKTGGRPSMILYLNPRAKP